MTGQALRRVLRTFRFAALFGAVGLVVLGIAIVTAALRYDDCGPSAMDAATTACRAGAYLLMAAYGLLSVALVLGAISLSLLWRLRRERRQR